MEYLLSELYPHLPDHNSIKTHLKELKKGGRGYQRHPPSLCLVEELSPLQRLDFKQKCRHTFFNNYFLQFGMQNINVEMHYDKNISHKYVKSVWFCI